MTYKNTIKIVTICHVSYREAPFSTRGEGPGMRFFIVFLLLANTCFAQQNNLKLWYNKPAEKWTDALPIGNGRLGAMIYGGVAEEHIQFNEETMWTGRPREYQRNGAYKYLQPIRQLLFDGKQAEAEALATQHFMGVKDPDDSAYTIASAAWLQKVRSNESPASIGFNDSKWPIMKLPVLNGWETAGLDGVDGALWFRTSFDLPQSLIGKDLFVDLGRIRTLDFTYINGKQIGSSEGISTKRHYKIDAALLKAGKNEIAVQVINFFDKGGFTGLKTGKPFVIYPADNAIKDTVFLSDKWKYWIQDDSPPSYPQYEASYQPFGDVLFQFSNQNTITDYKRELDISNAISSVSYTCNGTQFKREYFASAPDNAIVMRLSASKASSINLTALYAAAHPDFSSKKINDSTLALYVKIKDGALEGVSYLRVRATSGKVTISDKNITVGNVDEVVFFLSAATNFKSYKDITDNAETKASKALQMVANKDYQPIKFAHEKDYQKYFNTFSVRLGEAGKQALLPTDERLLQYSHSTDPGLLALYMQYGRYLLISSSRPGTQPANLQGIWNDNLTPPWGSKYTSNINLQMNYWPADLLNLSACNEPLFSMIDELVEAGKKTAKEHYNAPGWVLHHNTDLWRATAPINAANHGIWVAGAAWLCQHIWEHYLFTGDKDFLRKYYPAMKEAASFFTTFLIKDPKTGWLISTPSNSPEHGGLVAGPTMDHQIIRELFKNCIAASTILNNDKIFRQMLSQKKDSILPNTVGDLGELREWMIQKEDTTEKHRHVSHLWGVYPGADITWKDSAIMKAARQSLLYRGDDGTGWSLAWKVNLWARFKDGDHSLLMADKLLTPADMEGIAERGGAYKNLFDAHPPFQIDGNFGGAAGIAEMMVQSHEDAIELLPALPSSLAVGEMKGLCARGGFELDIQWADGKLKSVEVLSKMGNKCVLQYADKKISFKTVAGKKYKFDGRLGRGND